MSLKAFCNSLIPTYHPAPLIKKVPKEENSSDKSKALNSRPSKKIEWFDN
jgi:hypothetical protein